MTMKSSQGTTKINEMLEKVHGDRSSAHERVMMAIERILGVMYPKFDEDWKEQGYEEDDEGYVDQFEWSADTIEEVARSLHMYGLGPESNVRHELEIMLLGDDDEDDEGEDDESDD
jgi:hypothetical protein